MFGIAQLRSWHRSAPNGSSASRCSEPPDGPTFLPGTVNAIPTLLTRLGCEQSSGGGSALDSGMVNPMNEHTGYRFFHWLCHAEAQLSRAKQAEGYERFARDFESLPLDSEPYEGFAETMAYLCRRLARHRRAEAVEYRVPRGKWVTEPGGKAWRGTDSIS